MLDHPGAVPPPRPVAALRQAMVRSWSSAVGARRREGRCRVLLVDDTLRCAAATVT